MTDLAWNASYIKQECIVLKSKNNLLNFFFEVVELSIINNSWIDIACNLHVPLYCSGYDFDGFNTVEKFLTEQNANELISSKNSHWTQQASSTGIAINQQNDIIYATVNNLLTH